MQHVRMYVCRGCLCICRSGYEVQNDALCLTCKVTSIKYMHLTYMSHLGYLYMYIRQCLDVLQVLTRSLLSMKAHAVLLLGGLYLYSPTSLPLLPLLPSSLTWQLLRQPMPLFSLSSQSTADSHWGPGQPERGTCTCP